MDGSSSGQHNRTIGRKRQRREHEDENENENENDNNTDTSRSHPPPSLPPSLTLLQQQLEQSQEQLLVALDRTVMLRESWHKTQEQHKHQVQGDQQQQQQRDNNGLSEIEERVLSQCISLATSMGVQLQHRPAESTQTSDWIARTMAALSSLSSDSPLSSAYEPVPPHSFDGRETSSRHLPQHIVTSIVQFLPVSSLVSCVLVSKTFARACFAKGAIRGALVFDGVPGWPDSTFFHFLRNMLRDDPHKLDLIDTVRCVPPFPDGEYEVDENEYCDDIPSIFPALQVVCQGEFQNRNIKELRWRADYGFGPSEQEVNYLQSIYPNLTSIDLELEVCVPALLNSFPHLQELSIMHIREEDIIGHRELRPVQSLRKLALQNYESSLTLHYICHMFPSLTELSIEEVHSYDGYEELTISDAPLVRSRLLKDLSVPPLKKLSISGIALMDDDIYDDFIFRFCQLESIGLFAQSGERRPSETARLQTIFHNNQSLTEIETDRVLDVSFFQTLHTSRNPLHKLDARISVLNDLTLVADFKKLRQLDLEIDALSNPIRGSSSFRDRARRAIESLVELVNLTAPSYLGIEFECLPKLRRLQLTGRTSVLNIFSPSLEMLDIRSSTVYFATVTCRSLTYFRPSRSLAILQLNTPILSILQPLPKLEKIMHLSIRSQSLSFFRMSPLKNIISCNLDTPALRRMNISWDVLLTLVPISDDNDGSDKLFLLPSGLQSVRELTIESSDLLVDEIFARMIASFTRLDDLRFFGCRFIDAVPSSLLLSTVGATAAAELDHGPVPVPSVTTLKLDSIVEMGPLVKKMGHLFPNVQRFSLKHWLFDTMPEDDIVDCVTEMWSLRDLSIKGSPPPSPGFTDDSVRQIFEHLLTKGIIRNLNIILPSDSVRYSVELPPCSSLRELVTNVNIMAPGHEDSSDTAAVLPGVRFVNISNFNGLIYMESKQESRTLGKWLSRSFPNVESLDLQMLFSSDGDRPGMAYLLDELSPRSPNLKMVRYFSTASVLLDEFIVMRQSYPEIDFSLVEESRFQRDVRFR